MSPEFPKWARLSESKQTSVAVGITSTQLLRNNANRFAITFLPPLTNFYTVSARIAAVSGIGLVMRSTSLPVTLSWETHGDLVRGEWFAISDTAPQTVTVLETESHQ